MPVGKGFEMSKLRQGGRSFHGSPNCRFNMLMEVEDLVWARDVCLIASVIKNIRGASRRKIQAELFQVVRLAIFIKPPKFAEEALNIDLAFPDVTFSKRTVQGKGVSLSLSFLICGVRFGVDVSIVRQLSLENSHLAASSSVIGVDVIDAPRRLFIVP